MVRVLPFLKYYLDSEQDFEGYIGCFLEIFGHIDEDSRPDEVALAVLFRIWKGGGCRFKTEPAWIYRFFAREYEPEQLFAIVFAVWLGMDAGACEAIGDHRRKTYCWALLEYLLEGRRLEEGIALQGRVKEAVKTGGPAGGSGQLEGLERRLGRPAETVPTVPADPCRKVEALPFLRYYLNAGTYFYQQLGLFLERYGHVSGGREPEMNAFMAYLPPKGRQDVVAGRVYRRFMEQGQFTFYQEPAWIYRFFAREYGPEQLFAIIFAAWWGFPRRDCARLSGLETGAAAWEELNGLLERQKKTLREERAVWDGEHPSRG